MFFQHDEVLVLAPPSWSTVASDVDGASGERACWFSVTPRVRFPLQFNVVDCFADETGHFLASPGIVHRHFDGCYALYVSSDRYVALGLILLACALVIAILWRRARHDKSNPFWLWVQRVAWLAPLLSVALSVALFLDGDKTAPQPQPIVATTTGSGSPSPAPTSAPPTVLTQGHTRIINVEGVDLDNGSVQDQNAPGVDLSPSKTGDAINAMTNGKPRLAAPSPTGSTAAYDLCAALPPGSWTKQLNNIYGMRVGGHICVQTDQGNYAMLSLTHVPSAAEQHLEFDFITWRAR